MKLLVMPDAHLKIGLVNRIEQLWEAGVADAIISLGDWLDDWEAVPCEYEAFKIRFGDFVETHKKHLILLWGNHDYGYMCKPYQCSGFDPKGWIEHKAWLRRIDKTCPVHLVHASSKVLFSHAGVSLGMWNEYRRQLDADKIDCSFTVWLNAQFPNSGLLWQNDSLLWHRPHSNHKKNSFDPHGVLQVVGHTPVEGIKYAPEENTLYVDTWSTDSTRRPIGDQQLVVVDTDNQTWEEF